jgi:hypothetical protein
MANHPIQLKQIQPLRVVRPPSFTSRAKERYMAVKPSRKTKPSRVEHRAIINQLNQLTDLTFLPTPEVAPSTHQVSEGLKALRANITELSELHSRLNFMLNEVGSLIKRR